MLRSVYVQVFRNDYNIKYNCEILYVYKCIRKMVKNIKILNQIAQVKTNIHTCMTIYLCYANEML